MGVLVETTYLQPEVIKENKGGKEVVRFRGVFQRADVVNENGRRYPRKVLEKAIKEFEKKIKEGRAVGTLEHPLDGITRLDAISHKIVSVELKENGEVVGEFEVLDTSKGKDLRALLEAGVKIGISSRGFGSTKKIRDGDKEIEEVQEDFRFEAFDVVYNPSTPGGWVLLKESLNEAGLVRKEDVEKLVEELIEAFAEKFEEFARAVIEEVPGVVEGELENRPDIKAVVAVEAIARILAPIVPEIAEWIAEANCEEKEKLEEELKRRDEEIRRLTLENYKYQKISESAYPDELKEVLSEARTIEEVDRLVEDFKRRKRVRVTAEEKKEEKKPLFSKLRKFHVGGGQ